MLRKNRIEDIRSANTLLRIESRQKAVGKIRLYCIIGIIISLFAIYASVLLSYIDNYNEKIVLIICVSIFCALSIFLIIRSWVSRGMPLIFTEKGIFLYPRMAEFWEDIEEFGWKTFRGKGTTLYIISKRFQHLLEGYINHSILPQCGIFFTPGEIQEAERIFDQYGIRRIKDMAYVEIHYCPNVDF